MTQSNTMSVWVAYQMQKVRTYVLAFVNFISILMKSLCISLGVIVHAYLRFFYKHTLKALYVILGVMEFDSAIMDHRRRFGAVLSLRNIQTPVSVAKSVLGDTLNLNLCDFALFCLPSFLHNSNYII
jgi:Asparaginase